MNFTFELLHKIDNVLNDEIDVIVNLLEDKSKYHVTFVTYIRAKEIFEENRISLFSNTIFIEKLTEEEIQKSLKYVIDELIYQSIFYPINLQSIKKINRKYSIEQEIK